MPIYHRRHTSYDDFTDNKEHIIDKEFTDKVVLGAGSGIGREVA